MRKNYLKLFASVLFLTIIIASCNQILNPGQGGGGPRGGGGGGPRGGGGNHGGGGGPRGGGGGISNENGSDPNDFFDMTAYSGQIIRDITYATGVKTYQGTVENLNLDIYMPENPTAGKKYPLVLFAHGGGFLVGDKKTSKGFCAGYANSGYVAATINYRLGWEKDRTVLCSGDSLEAKQAIYRAIQDARAALRFLVHHANEYSIDTNWIFITGPSAGGAITMQTTYLTQESADGFLPGARSSLGYLDKSGNNLTDKFTIKGCANLWGGIGDIQLINSSTAVPCICYHGMKDLVSPFEYNNMYTCELFLKIYGSKAIYDRLKSLGVPTIAHIDPMGGHGVYGQNFILENTICFFNKIVQKQKIESQYLTTEVSSCK